MEWPTSCSIAAPTHRKLGGSFVSVEEMASANAAAFGCEAIVRMLVSLSLMPNALLHQRSRIVSGQKG
jgi:hypothetical protein